MAGVLALGCKGKVMADQTVKIDGVDAPSRVAFDMAKFIWYGAGKSDPKDTASAKQFLGLVADCTMALRGGGKFSSFEL